MSERGFLHSSHSNTTSEEGLNRLLPDLPRIDLRNNHFEQSYPSGHLVRGRRRGRQRKCWIGNIKEWTFLPMPELLTRAYCRKDWKRITAESPWRPSRSRDWVDSPATEKLKTVYSQLVLFYFGTTILALAHFYSFLKLSKQPPTQTTTFVIHEWFTQRRNNTAIKLFLCSMTEYCTVAFSSWEPESDPNPVVEYVFRHGEADHER